MPVAAYAKRVGQVVAMIVLLGPPAMAGDAAHTIADKFSGPEQTQPTADERRKAEEERKREAARKAQEALREEARLRAEAALKADREKQLAQMKKAGAPAAKSDQQPATDEDEMLARARLEAQQREQAETAVARAKRIEETERARRQMDDLLARQLQPAQESTDEARVAMIAAARTAYRSAVRRGEIARAEADAEAARRQAVATAVRIYRDGSVRRETAARVLAEAEAMHQRVAAAVRVHREATARAATQAAVAERERQVAAARSVHRTAALRQAETLRVAAERERARVAEEKAETAAHPVAGGTAGPRATADLTSAAVGTNEGARLTGRFTLLLVMQPGNRGIRRHNKTADPVVCLYDGCFVSSGAGSAATFLPGQKALGFGNTWGGRAGACRAQLGCVFRGLPATEAPVLLQPVDMHILKHDRRRPQAVVSDSACRMEGARLVCLRGIYADDYSMWIVPEDLAAAAGPEALQRAVEEGLNGPRSAALNVR